MALLMVGCVGLTAVLNRTGLPALFAYTDPAPVPTLQIDRVGQTPQAPPVSSGNMAAAAPQALEVLPALPTVPQTVPPQVLPAPEPVAPKAPAKKAGPEIRTYNGQKYRYVKTIKLRVTAYAPDVRCTWPYPGTTTASGLSVKTNHGRLVAADPRLIPLHSLVAVPGYAGGLPVPVLDTGGAIKGSRLDVLLPNFDDAKEWGSRMLNVKIYEPID
jgi:3D (Asp-Asp-Asp) domain-containing protein